MDDNRKAIEARWDDLQGCYVGWLDTHPLFSEDGSSWEDYEGNPFVGHGFEGVGIRLVGGPLDGACVA